LEGKEKGPVTSQLKPRLKKRECDFPIVMGGKKKRGGGGKYLQIILKTWKMLPKGGNRGLQSVWTDKRFRSEKKNVDAYSYDRKGRGVLSLEPSDESVGGCP